MKIKYLTWEDLAELYKERVGGQPFTMTMESIYNWAKKESDIVETKGGLRLKFVN